MEPWRGFARRLSTILCYVACFPFDIILYKIISGSGESYFGGSVVQRDYYLMIGFFVRPALTLVIALAMSWLTIGEVWVDIRKQRWKGRWRFRHDAPIMVGKGAYPAIAASQ